MMITADECRPLPAQGQTRTLTLLSPTFTFLTRSLFIVPILTSNSNSGEARQWRSQRDSSESRVATCRVACPVLCVV